MALSKSAAFSKDEYIEAINILTALKDNGAISGTDTVNTTLTNLATERDKQ